MYSNCWIPIIHEKSSWTIIYLSSRTNRFFNEDESECEKKKKKKKKEGGRLWRRNVPGRSHSKEITELDLQINEFSEPSHLYSNSNSLYLKDENFLSIEWGEYPHWKILKVKIENPCPKTFLAQRCGDVSADARIEKSDRQTNNHESMTKSRFYYLQMMFHHSLYTFTDFLDFLHLLINTIVVVMTCGCPNLETAQRWQKILVCSAWLLGVGRVSSKRLSNLFAVRRRAEIIPI